ncbi:MAG: Nif11-like leader peptide family RiPP precursor [Actinomycetota bacterium]
MSTEQAQQLIRRAMEDDAFRERIEAAPTEERRSILAAEGYGDVRLSHIAAALPTSAGGELSDEDFAAVAGSGGTATSAAVSGSVGGTATFVVTVAIAAAA